MTNADFSKDKKDVPAERTQGQEFAPDREESPSADWVQHSNEETIVYSQAGRTEGFTDSNKNDENKTQGENQK